MPHYLSSEGQLFYFDKLPEEGVRKDLVCVTDEYVASITSPVPEPVDEVKNILTDILRDAMLDKGYTPAEAEELLAKSEY